MNLSLFSLSLSPLHAPELKTVRKVERKIAFLNSRCRAFTKRAAQTRRRKKILAPFHLKLVEEVHRRGQREIDCVCRNRESGSRHTLVLSFLFSSLSRYIIRRSSSSPPIRREKQDARTLFSYRSFMRMKRALPPMFIRVTDLIIKRNLQGKERCTHTHAGRLMFRTSLSIQNSFSRRCCPIDAIKSHLPAGQPVVPSFSF